VNTIWFIVFDETACLARGKNINDRKRAVSVLSISLWPQIKATSLRGGRLQGF
jgi:hypothetical protein